MPTYEWVARFQRDFEALSSEQQEMFLTAIGHFVEDCKAQRGFRKGLRVKGIQGATGVFEMTWADNGRATFEYGETRLANEPHIIWRRVGTHAVFTKP